MAAKAKAAAADAPKSELVVTRITPKGINAVITNVVLNWVFLAKPAEDKDDPLKASYRTQMILRGGEKDFINTMKTALTQYLKSASIAWGADVRLKKLQTALSLDVDKSLFKTTENGISLAAHLNVYRASDTEAFPLPKMPVQVRLSDNSECPAGMITQELYSGAIADVAVFIAAYEVKNGSGITMYLNGVRKIADGERISGIDPFADVPTTTLLEGGVSGKGLLL